MKTRIFAVTATLALACLLALGSTALAAPPEGGESTNRMSFPAIYNIPIPASWDVKEDDEGGLLGVDYSYGCDKPEMDGQFSYPNTSCVNSLMDPTVYLNAAACTAAGGPCDGLPVSRIYWQKNAENIWSADQDTLPASGYASVAYLDWGDALEAVSWTETSKIRVETQPYSSTIWDFDPFLATCENAAVALALNPAIACKVGFQMWHVSGQGITEQWGVRADEAGVSYNYDSPFQIIKTDRAMLNIAKLGTGSAECPSPGGGEEGEIVLAAYDVPAAGDWENNEWSEAAYTFRNDPYSVETSVGGKYVYGYNLSMTDVEMPVGVDKTGWWRLTFYTTDNSVWFDDPLTDGLLYYNLTAPPAVPTAVRVVPRAAGTTPVAPQIGVFRNGPWYLDASGDGAWEAGIDTVYASFGGPGDLPVVGDWNGNGITQIGVFRGGKWYLDANNNGAWDPSTDIVHASFGGPGDLPVVGDWNGNGIAQIGVFRGGKWYLDANNNGAWDPGIDTVYANYGWFGDLPFIGDWDGDGIASEIGVFRDGSWYLDANNNGAWDPGTDIVYASFGGPGDLPIIGDWNGDGIASEIGVFRSGKWYLDANNNGAWDPGIDTVYASFGGAGDKPLIKDVGGSYGDFIVDTMPEPFMGAAELYQPVVDVTNNLTYLDICIRAKAQGGGQ